MYTQMAKLEAPNSLYDYQESCKQWRKPFINILCRPRVRKSNSDLKASQNVTYSKKNSSSKVKEKPEPSLGSRVTNDFEILNYVF